MSIVALSIANYLNIPTHATINAGNPENELVQDLQEQTESQSPCIGHHTPIFESLRPDELNMPNANGSGFRQESMTNIDSSFVWSATMPPGDHELGSSPPYFFPNRVLQPFPYDSQLMEPLSWNAEQPQDLSQGRNTLHSALGSFSYMSQGSWMEPIYPALYSSAESVKYKENANGNISQMSFVPDSCPRTIDTDNHSTSLGQTTRVAYSHAIVTDGGHFTPRQVRNGCSSVSLKPRETCGKKSSRRKVFRHSLSSSSSRSASSKKKPQFREAKRPFVEYMFHASSGEPAVAGSNKRRRTKDEKQETARIRELGGACEPCRRQHRKCALKHHQDSPSTKNITNGYSNNPRPTVLQHGNAYSPNFPHAYQVASSVSTSNSSVRASSPATQHETEVATPLDFQTPSENFNHTTWDTVEVGGQFQDTRNIIPGRDVPIVRGDGSLVLPGNNFDGIWSGSCHMDEVNIDNYQLAAYQTPDIFNDIEENVERCLSLWGLTDY